MPTNEIVKTQRHVRLYIGLGVGVLLAAAVGLIYVFSGSAS